MVTDEEYKRDYELYIILKNEIKILKKICKETKDLELPTRLP